MIIGKIRKGQKVHFERHGQRHPACGALGKNDRKTTDNPPGVTCEECLKIIDAIKKA